MFGDHKYHIHSTPEYEIEASTEARLVGNTPEYFQINECLESGSTTYSRRGNKATHMR